MEDDEKLSFREGTETAGVWLLDFVRALRERPRFVRWLIRLLIGKHAAKELAGGIYALERAGLETRMSYGCEDVNYRREYKLDL